MKVISYIGFILFLLGAGGMDSPSIVAPAIMFLIGFALIAISAAAEGSAKK